MTFLNPPVVFGKFEVLEFISVGLSGEVYKARLRDDRELVALKILTRADDPTVSAYFNNEQLLLREISRHRSHPNIVGYVTSSQVNRPYYLATRFVDGSRGLDQLTGRPMTAGFVLRVAEQIGAALDYLHFGHPTFSPIIHRDVKPHNILIDGKGNAILIDLSIARHTAFGMSEERGLGSIRYMAPEQYAGHEEPATDQFALATVVLHMLTGAPLLPADGDGALRMLQELATNDYIAVDEKLGRARAQTARVIKRALQADPARRYATCDEFTFQLRRAMARDGMAVHRAQAPLRLPGLKWNTLFIIGITLFAIAMLVWSLSSLTLPL